MVCAGLVEEMVSTVSLLCLLAMPSMRFLLHSLFWKLLMKGLIFSAIGRVVFGQIGVYVHDDRFSQTLLPDI